MKVVSADIVHKVAAGGVLLNVSADRAAAAFKHIMEACKASCPDAAIDGVLVEEMIAGDIELFIGARIDSDYGPVVLLGLGGTGVEDGPAPAAALAPLTHGEAEELMNNAFPPSILHRLPSTTRHELKEYLLAVAGPEGILFREDVGELDINPVIVGDSGLIAVDAVVGELSPELSKQRRSNAQVDEALAERRMRLEGLSALFNPKSIAFIGASTSPSKLGYRNLRNLIDFDFTSPLYPIHPSADEICGKRAYRSILDVPSDIERAYIAVAAKDVPAALAECTQKGVKVAQVLTAGFSEWTGGEAGDPRSSDNFLRNAFEDSEMRVVGPNCLGTFSVSGRLTMGSARYCPQGPGGITFISQSGTFAGDLVRRAQVIGLPVGQVLSCGNCLDLDFTDYLLFCEDDAETNIIVLYAESINDPGLFFRATARVTKPIVIFRGGATDQGLAAASSHTAALTTDKALWEAAIRQHGILEVNTLRDLIDILTIHTAHGTTRGNRLGVFGSGGGVSVTSADFAAKQGMQILPLAKKTASQLQNFAGPGTSVSNPIDIPVWGLQKDGEYILEGIINCLKDDSNIDSVIVYIEMGSIMDFVDHEQDGLHQLEQICDSVARCSPHGPQISLVLRSTGDKVQEDFLREQRFKMLGQGIAVFASTTAAVHAHSMLWRLSKKKPKESTSSTSSTNGVANLKLSEA